MRQGLASLLVVALAGCSAAPRVTSEQGLEAVARGEPEAIDAAAKALAKAKPAEAAKLHDALAHAMQVAPDHVLPLLATNAAISPGDICVYHPAEGSPPQEVKAELAKSRKAIESVTDPKLAGAKEACLAELVQAETAVDRGEEQ